MFKLLICYFIFSAIQTNLAVADVQNNSTNGETYCCDDRRTCNEITYSTLSYFVNPSTFQQDCPLRIKIYSSKICQIRLDFEDFEIYPPTTSARPDIIQQKNGMAYKCYVDKFKVEKASQHLGFSSLCGKNGGQHIYIPVQRGQSEIVLRFLLSKRTSSMMTQNPRWKIKIRQIDCSCSSNHKLIAPPNCLQYYHDYYNKFESFNYDDGKGCYIGGLDYSICFRKDSDICSIEYSPVDFQMNYNELGQIRENEDRCHPNREAEECLSQDYIRINEGKLSNGRRQDYFCGQNFKYATSKSHEPLYLKVHTDNYRAYATEDCNENSEDHEEIGFRILYELENCSY